MLLTVLKCVDLLRLLSACGLTGLITAEIWGRCNEDMLSCACCVYWFHYFICLNSSLNIVLLWDNVEKYSTTGQDIDESIIRRLLVLAG